MSTAVSDAKFDQDKDSLYVLPLRMLPLGSAALRRLRMVKDSRMKSAVELFVDDTSGSGQVYLSELSAERFGVEPGELETDFGLLSRVAELDSFDVYTLRMQLRRLQIDVESADDLDLSPEKKDELKDYMKKFTLPLIEEIYGRDDVQIERSSDIIQLFADPDVAGAARRLKALAQNSRFEISEIPAFLEDFSDVYLSLAYFQQQLDDIVPKVFRFIEEIGELRTNWQMRQERRALETCARLEIQLNNIVARITGRFEIFHRGTNKMWEDVTAERFEKVATLIRSNHTVVGGVLCGLGSKMNAWRSHFPNENAGGVLKRGDVIMSDIAPGMDKILKLDLSATIAA